MVGPALEGWMRIFLPLFPSPRSPSQGRAPSIALSCKGGSARLFSRKKRGKICRKSKSFAGRRAGSRAAQAAQIPEKHPDAAGSCPSTAGSANGGKMGLKPKGAGLAVPSLAGFVLLEERERGTGGAQPSLRDEPGCREWSQHPGMGHFTPARLLQLWDGAHGGREGNRPRAAPQGATPRGRRQRSKPRAPPGGSALPLLLPRGPVWLQCPARGRTAAARL